MATRKAVKKIEEKATQRPPRVSTTVKKAGPVAGTPQNRASVPEAGGKKPQAAAVPLNKTVIPVARTCPLVLDGEMDAADFSPIRCFSCDEFDCRFCATAQGSGLLRSRLFACEEDDDADGDDAWNGDSDSDDSLDTEGDEVEGDDLF